MTSATQGSRTVGLWGYYLVALLLIAALNIAAYLVLSSYIAVGSQDAHAINLLGRQRMLSQQLLAHHLRYHAAGAPQVQKRVREEIAATWDHFASGHRFLLSLPLDDHGFSEEAVAETRQSIGEVDRHFQRLRTRILQGIEPDPASLTAAGAPSASPGTDTEAVVAEAEGFLAAMDRTVLHFEQLAQQRVSFHQRLALAIVFLVLGLLAVEARVIFRPMTARILAHQRLLEVTNRQLQTEIADREQTERKLTEARQAAWQQEKLAAIGRLAAGIVHEIGNPLAALQGLTDSASEKLKQQQYDTLDEALAQISDHIQRLESITREVSTFSAPRSQEPELISLNEVASLVTTVLRYDTNLAHVRLELDLDKELPAIRGISDQLWQVLMNLVLNAADAVGQKADADPRITVATRRLDDTAELSVSDRGIGMDESAVEVALEPFQTTKMPGEGMGLGLSLCHAIVSRHDGTMAIESTPGLGTTVRVRLPLPTV